MRHLAATLLLVTTLLAAVPAAGSDDGQTLEAKLVAIEDLRRSGKFEDAVVCARELVDAHPGNLPAHVAYQDLQIALGKGDELVQTYRRASKAPDAGADDQYLLARLLHGRDAVRSYRAALKESPDHFWALCGLGSELTSMGKLDDAAATLERAAELDQKSAVPCNLLGRLAERQGAAGLAEKHYRKAIELDPDLTLARVNLGVLLVGLERRDEARKTLTAAAERAPADPMPLLGLGVAAQSAGDNEGAAGWFEKATQLDTNSVTSLNLLANAYIQLGRLDNAEKALDAALDRNSDHAETRVNKAHLHLLRGENSLAEVEAKAAIEARPELPEAHFMLGLCYERENESKKAENEYRRGAKFAPENPVFPRALAILYEGQGRWKDAIRMYKTVVELSDGSVDALIDLGLAEFDGRKHEDAVESFEAVLRVEPKNLTALLNLGLLHQHHVKDRKKAAQCYRDYLDNGGTDVRVRDWLAEVEGR